MTTEQHIAPNYPKAVLGTIVGAFLGYLAFMMLVKLGVYGMVISGALVGLGCGAQSGAKSPLLGAVAAVVALILSVFLEWHFFPFSEDNSLRFFLTNLNFLPTITKLMIGLSTFAGFWFGRGR